ncbi:MAG: carbohydrate ABC transporter permease [Phycisphaerales bacterium JB040]
MSDAAAQAVAEPARPAFAFNTLKQHGVLTPHLFLIPALLVLGVFLIASTFEVVRYSFSRYNPFTGETEFVGLENYARLLADPVFFRALANSFLYLLVTPLLVALSLMCALIVDTRVRGSNLFRFLFFLPVVTPTIVAAVAWRLLYNEDSGLLNTVLNAVGLGGVGWLTTHPWTLLSAMLVTAWKGFGFYMLVFLAALLGVPRELKEAAAIDGAGVLGTFRAVTLPAIRPTMALVVIISSISALKVFDELFVTVRGVPMDQQTAVPLVYDLAFVQSNFGMACAAGLVLFVVILAFSLVNLAVTGGAGEDRG